MSILPVLRLSFLCLCTLHGITAHCTTEGRLTLDLNGRNWQMEGIRPGQGVKEGFQEYFGEVCPSTFNWNGAQVPGDVYTDLWRAGEIDDPHFGRNGIRAKWAMEKEWWYRKKFGIPDGWEGKTVRLIFEGVDYSCEVWINGHYLGSHEGMFSSFEFEVSDKLLYQDKARANGVVLKLNPPPRTYYKVAGRKFAWHGDYWRTITPMGIWKGVRLEATGPAHFTDVHPKSDIHEDGSATVKVGFELDSEQAEAAARVKTVIRGKNFESEPYTVETTTALEAGANTLSQSVKIPDAQLWWPWDMGKPNLYEAETFLYDSRGVLVDQQTTSFGIREITREFNPGFTRKEVVNPWTVLINGKKAFLRSASWGGPPDIFYGRNTPEKYRKLVKMAKECNINNLRIFGWHPTEIDLFYELCDEMGITVWQNLIPLASIRIPEDKAFRDATYAEAVSVMKDLRNFPSLIFLEGGEEMFYGTQGLDHNADFLIGLEEAIRPYTDLPYVATSPLNYPSMLHRRGLGGPKDSGHTHALFYTPGRYLMEDYVQKWDFAVIPEFAVSSPPNVESIKKFIPEDELWPPGPSWGFHWADLDAFRTLNFQVFGDEKTDSLEEFVYASQVNQGTCFQWGLEHFRRRKPQSTAIAICHFITWAPDMKWGIVDYYQETKESYDFVKRAYQPLLVSLETRSRFWLPGQTFDGSAWIVNDFHHPYADCSLKIRIANKPGEVLLEKTVTIDAIGSDSCERVAPIEWTVPDNLADFFRVSLELTDADGKVISSNYYDLRKGDQEKARKDCETLSEQFRQQKLPFPTADYYRHELAWPEQD